MIVNLDWETYQIKFLGISRTFVIENDADWTLYTDDGLFIIKCIVEKFSDQTENIMFVERYLTNNPSVIKVDSILTPQQDEKLLAGDEFDDFFVKREHGEGQMVDKILEEELQSAHLDEIEKKKKIEYKDFTSTDDEHYHYYEEENGEGLTSGTYPEDFIPHVHIIKDYKILDHNGHIHTYGN